MDWWIWVIIIIAVILVIMLISYFNRFVVLKNRIDNSFAQIDVQLKKRADLVPNLMESVKGYMKHEAKIMTEVSEARKALVSANQGKDMVKRVKAGDDLQGVLGRLFAIAENYPNLKANENFLQFQQELSAIEDKIAYARQFYNDSILAYNNTCKTWPGVWFAGIYGKKPENFIEIPVAERETPKVKF
ncbi:MAG: LemA family protein [archaeon]